LKEHPGDNMATINAAANAFRRFAHESLILTENVSVPVDIRRQAIAALKRGALQSIRIKSHKYKEVFFSGHTDSGTRFVFKKQKNPTLSTRTKALKGGVILRKEYNMYRELQRLGVPAPGAILLGECYSWGLLKESFLVTEWLAGQTVVELYDMLLKNGDTKAERAFFAALARYVAMLWQAGVVHSDLNPGNILVGSTSSGRYTFYLLDVYQCQIVRRPDPSNQLTAYVQEVSTLLLGLWLRAQTRYRSLFYCGLFSMRLLGINKADRHRLAVQLRESTQQRYAERVLKKRD
jgi:serine/threonine-protein kinase RIO1